MATPPIDPKEAARRKAMVEQCLTEGFAPLGRSGVGRGSAVYEAAKRLGIDAGTLGNTIRTGKIVPDWSLFRATEPKPIIIPTPQADPGTIDRVLASLRTKPLTLIEIAVQAQISKGQALDALEAAKERGLNLHLVGEHWSVERTQTPAFAQDGEIPVYMSRPDNTFVFGAVADSHLGSKYERLDCLNDIYDRFVTAKVDRVFHAGNWIEGEARFNKTDISVHGMDRQIEYCVQKYPQRPGIHTYAVTGDDHEGWYAQREAIDIGRHLENQMRRAGREDWHNLGFMEAHVRLVNANTGKWAILAVVHPGGGSAYADSYVVQKIIESLDGGEKPAVALYGHYHKCLAGEYRNVWWVLVPSTKDQDIFMRKKRLRSVVGGGIIGLEQDPETGAIIGMSPKLWRYFNKGYYNDRWSHSGEVILPERMIA